MDKFDVLYIHPLGKKPNFDVFLDEKTYFPFIPMGVIGIVNNLKTNGSKVKGINLALKHLIYGPHFLLEKYLGSIDVNIFLIDIHWYLHIKDGLKVANLCKKIKPNSKIIIGGMSASIFSEQLIRYDSIDFILKGDSEESCALLVGLIIKGNKEFQTIPGLIYKKGKTACKEIININKYDYVDISFLEENKQYIERFNHWLLIAKGCLYKCECCDGNCNIYPNIYKRQGLIIRDPNLVVKDIKRLEGKANFVNFSHDISMLGTGFSDILLANTYKTGMRNEFFQLPSIEIIKKLSNSFSVLDLVFSPISGSYCERKIYGKNFTNYSFFGLLKKIFNLRIKGGVTIYFSDYMIAPGIREKLNAKAREKMIKKIKKIYPGAIIEVQNQIIDPMCLIKEKGFSKEELFKAFI